MSQYTASIQALYVAYFNRPADPSGLAYWEIVVAKANGNTAAVSAEFAKSPEYKAAYAGLSDDAVINQVYMNIFGRQVDSQGLNFWSPKLTAHLVTIDQIVTEVAKGAQLSDLTTYNNRVTASVAYTDALNADVNLRLAYSNAAAIESAKSFLNGITDDASLTAAIAPAALAANLAQMVIDAAPVGSTFTLSTGVDLINGTASNDVFNAAPDAGAATFTALDKINGGAGTDTLNITSIGALDLTLATGATITSIEKMNLIATTTVGTTALGGEADVSGFAGLTKVTVAAVSTDLVAAATTDVVASTTANAIITGGKSVTATSTGGNVTVNDAAGAVVATTAVGDVAVNTAAGAIIANSAGAVTITGAKAAVTSVADGAVSIGGATSINSTITNVSAQQLALDTAAASAAATAATAAGTANGLAVTAAASAAAKVAALTTMKTAIAAATTQVQFDAAIDAGVAAGAITGTAGVGTSLQEATLSTGFAAGLATGGTAAQALAAAQANVVAYVDSYVAAAATANATAITAAATAASDLVAATDAKTAADDALALDVLYATGATTNTALTSAKFVGGDTVALTDASTSSNTLTSVSLNATGNATLTGKALTTVSIANSIADVSLVNSVAHAATFNLDAVTAGTITDTTATSVALNATTKSTVALSAGAATSLALGGAGALTATVTAAQATAATITGAGGVSLNMSGLAAAAVVTATASTGTNSIKVGATQSYLGGSGNDIVTMTASNTTKAINGGAGAADEMVIGFAGSFDVAAATNVTGFEVLGAGATATGTLNATGFAKLHVGGGTLGGAVTFSNVAAGTGLTIDGAAGAAVAYQLKDITGTTDAVTVNLGSATKVGFAVGGAVDLTGIEAVTINGVAKSGTNSIIVTDADATSLTVTGTAATTITGLASGTVKTINLSAATKMVDVSLITVDATGATFTAGAGGAKMTGGAGVDTFNGGAGVDTIHGGAGNDIIIGGGGKDIIWGDAGADRITLSGTGATLKFAALDTGVNSSTSFQTAELTTTMDIVTGATTGAKIDLAFLTTANYQTDLVLSAANLAGVDNKVVFASGTYDAAAGTFTYAANGADTVVTYDTDASGGIAFQSVVLVGYHTSTTTSVLAGVITL